MTWIEALGLRERETVTLIGSSSRVAVMFGIAHELREIAPVVTTSTVRLRVPTPQQCDACVADAATEVAYRDTIERIKYFAHVHSGIGGSGGFVTTRTSNIGRHYKPSPDTLLSALHRNPSIPYLLVCGDALDSAETDSTPALPEVSTRILVVLDLAPPEDLRVLAGAIDRIPVVPSREIHVVLIVPESTDPPDARAALDAALPPGRVAGAVLGRTSPEGIAHVLP